MKRQFPIIFIILLTLIACKKDKKLVVNLGDGQKEIKYYPNKKDTTSYLREFYYTNGQLGTVGRFVNNKMDSVWTWFYSNGKIKDYAILEDGLYTKEKWHWYPNGNIKQIEYISTPCAAECCDGEVLYYDSLGILHQKVQIKNGMRQDTFFQYWDNGNIFIASNYNDDVENGFYREYHRNKSLWVKGQFINGKKEGSWEWYDSLGTLTIKNRFINDEIVE